eukprot:4463563-Prorocentrum_lima.AAC.1
MRLPGQKAWKREAKSRHNERSEKTKEDCIRLRSTKFQDILAKLADEYPGSLDTPAIKWRSNGFMLFVWALSVALRAMIPPSRQRRSPSSTNIAIRWKRKQPTRTIAQFGRAPCFRRVGSTRRSGSA